MILDEDSIYPFLTLALVPLSSKPKLGWQATYLVRRCCIPIGIIVCLFNAMNMLATMNRMRSLLLAQRLMHGSLAFGIFFSFLLYLVEPKTTDELKLSSLGICSLGVLLIFSVLGAVFSITGDVPRTNLFIHMLALMIFSVIGLICFVYPDFLGYTLIQKAYKASLASVMVFFATVLFCIFKALLRVPKK